MKAAISLPHPTVPARRYFLRAAFADARATAQPGTQPSAYLRADDDISPRLLMRAAVDPASTTTTGWAAELQQNAFRDFLENLEPYSAASRLIARGIPAKLAAATQALYPVRVGQPSQAPWVAENDPIPVRSGSFGQVQIGPRRKVASIIVLSRESLRRADGLAIMELMLSEDIGTTLDLAYFATTAGSAAAHAGLLYNVTPLTASTGSFKTAIEEDLIELARAVATGGSGEVIYFMRPELAEMMKILAPELRRSLDIATSAAIPSGRVIAADPRAILHAVDEMPDIEASKNAIVHMEDENPLPISSPGGPPVVADPVISTFQMDAIALRIIADLAFQKRRANAVAYIDGIEWGWPQP